MKRFIMLILLVAAVVAGAFVINHQKQFVNMDDITELTNESVPKIKSQQEEKEILPLLEGDLFELIGKGTEQLKEQFGKPKRKDKSAYGYTWWVYTNGETEYVQFGVENGKTVIAFATGEDVAAEPLEIGKSYEEINKEIEFKEEVTYQNGMEFYKFLMSEGNMETDPLIKISDDIFVQCYFDTIDDELSSIRVITGDVLLKQRIYEMEYRGNLPEKPVYDDKEWAAIEDGMEKQIFDLTNVYRNRFDILPVDEDKDAHDVAYLHSKDMMENNYFSHYTPNGEGLKERLEQKNVYYMTAGENIAAQHTDGPGAMEGWLNSQGHREALLNEDYTHVGIGVSRLYYTQNFLSKL